MKTTALAMALAITATIPAHAQAPYEELTTTEGMQVSVGPCVTRVPRLKSEDNGETKAFLAAVAASLVTKGVSALGAALGKLGDAKTWSDNAARNFETRKGATFPQCVQIARGTFSTASTRTSAWTLPGWPDGTYAVLAKNGMPLTSAPNFLFEGEFIASTLDPGAITIRPTKVTFVKPHGGKAGRGEERGIALFMAISTPGTKPNLSTNPGATIVLGQMKGGSTRTFPQQTEELEHIGQAGEPNWFTLGKDDVKKPLTISVLETETLEKDKFLKFIGSVLSDKSVTDEVAEQGRVLLVPGAADDAALKKEIADLKATAEVSSKETAAVVKLQACIASGAASDSVAARTALNDYLEADQKLDTPNNKIAASMIKAVDSTKPSGTIKGACLAAYGALTS